LPTVCESRRPTFFEPVVSGQPKKEKMIYRVELTLGSQFQGMIEFYDLPVQAEHDYRCDPKGLLTPEEVILLSRTLQDLPTVYWGNIGKFQWQEQQAIV
jgi:hypothetical protein